MRLLGQIGRAPKGGANGLGPRRFRFGLVSAKADQCDQLAKDASQPEDYARYQEEARLWREIAADIAKNERNRFGSDSE